MKLLVLCLPFLGCAPTCEQQGGRWVQEGMTLRDYFAAKAMQGMIANSNLIVNGMFSEDNFEVAYKAADAMLKARAA